ncbi:hypothetical protein EW026_g2801, partial [Hermanssonia centrifuga]
MTKPAPDSLAGTIANNRPDSRTLEWLIEYAKCRDLGMPG